LANETIRYTGNNYNTPVTATPTKTGSGQYGPTNSSQLQDESGGVPPDSLDPSYAFYSQDTYFINAVYNNMVEFNMSSGTEIVPVLASYYGISNGGCTNWFHLRSGVTFSNGDPFNAYVQWFSIVRTQVTNAPTGISTSNWNLVSYNTTMGGQFGSGSYEYNTLGAQFPWGLRQAIQVATGLQTAANTQEAVTLAEKVLTNMLSNFNPANATQLAIMSYPNQAYAAANSTLFVADYLRSLGPLGPQWWAGFDGQQPVDPVFVDSPTKSGGCSGVQVNAECPNYSDNGGPGTGPYEIKSIGPGMTPIVLVANPTYFALSASGVPEIARPPSIRIIIYSPWKTDSQAISDFANNTAQLSYESQGNYGQMYGGLPAGIKSEYKFNQILRGIGGYDFSMWLNFNEAIFPTNNTDFRMGIAQAMNYTALEIPYEYNGTAYETLYAGPLTPAYFPYYDPLDYSVPSQNTTAAWNFFNKFGLQTSTYMVVPNSFVLSNGSSVSARTTIGDAHGTELPSIALFYYPPLTADLDVTLTVIRDSLAPFGIQATPYAVTCDFGCSTGSPQTFPPIEAIGWGSDFNDPFYTQFYPTMGYAGPYNGWFSNSTVLSEATACFLPSTQAQITSCDDTLYKMAADNQIFVYLPVPTTNLFFVQPYLQGMNDNTFVGTFYNLLYYQPVASS